MHTVFNLNPNNQLKEPMFFGNNLNLSRFDVQKYPIFEKLSNLMLSFFWRPEEVNITKDKNDFKNLTDAEQHVFTSNLFYQTCLVEGTQVLTKQGWVNLTELNKGEAILIYDINNNTTKWEVPSRIINQPYSGKVYEIKSDKGNSLNQVVTPDHRIPYITRKTFFRKFITAEDFECKNSINVPLIGNLRNEGENKQNYLSPLERLMIATQADGSVYKRYTGKYSKHVPILFSFSKARKIARLLEIAKECNFPVIYRGERIHKGKNCKNTHLYKVYVPAIYNPHAWKDFDWVDIGNVTNNWCREFVEELLHWDGSIYKNDNSTGTNYYCSTNYKCALTAQTVGALAGYSARLSIRKDDRKDHYKDLYSVYFVTRQHRNGESITKKKRKYSGTVSCVTVSTGAFVVKYNNAISVTGNCLDSVQSRSVALMYLPLVSIPELESVIEIWSFQELIHSRSYTHIIRNIYDDPSKVFDKIMFTPEILARAKAINTVYDDLVNGINEFKNVEDRLDDTARSTLIKSLKKKLIKALFTTYMLEGVRFYLSFVCSFSFAERKQMEGNAKVIRFIARDEMTHLTVTEHIFNIINNTDDDIEMKEIFSNIKDELLEIAKLTANQEKEWASYLFSKGPILGLSENGAIQYIEHLIDKCLSRLGLSSLYGNKSNPFTWANHWFNSDNVQVAPQETEITSYLTGEVNNQVNKEEVNELNDLLD